MKQNAVTQFWIFLSLLFSVCHLQGQNSFVIDPPSPLIPAGSIWRYLDDGSDQGSEWRGLNFDDNAWAAGLAQLGYGDGDEATILSFGTDSANKHITTYFRKYFEVHDASSVSNLFFRVLRDDGVVLYRNGVEIYRNNLPAVPITHRTLAFNAANENEYLAFTVPPNSLASGRNVLAAEVHQISPTSSDLSFDLELVARGGTRPPEVSFVNIFATDPEALEPHPLTDGPVNNGRFTIRREGGDLSHPLIVRYQIHGGAINGTDYESISNAVVIPSGSNEVAIDIVPFEDLILEEAETVTLRLQAPLCATVMPPPPGCYHVGASSNATVTIYNQTIIINQPPVVEIIEPDANESFAENETITIHATTMDQDGYASRVEFFANNHKLGEQELVFITPPEPGTPLNFEFQWTNAPAGEYALTARTTDNNGVRGVSEPVRITVTRGNNEGVVIPERSVWKYFDQGNDLGSDWREPGFDDSSWSSGSGQLGYGDGDEATIVSFGDDASNKHITTYFRKSFEISNAANVSNMVLRVLRDDGVVVYLNGIEIFRDNLPAGPVSFGTLALTASFDENEYIEVSVAPTALVSGVNVLAAEVHQVNATSSDLGFDLGLRLERGGIVHESTVVSVEATDPVASEPGVAAVIDHGTFTFRRTGNINHAIPVYFRISGSASNGSDYSLVTNRITIPAGQLEATLNIVASQDNRAEGPETVTVNIEEPACIAVFPPPPQCYETGIPSTATITIIDSIIGSNFPPVIEISQPSEGARFEAGSNIRISAVGSDPDGVLALVEFFANGRKIGESEDVSGRPPQPRQPSLFSIIWSNAPAGDYELTARTTDAGGATATSEAVRIRVGNDEPRPPVVSVVATWPNTSEPGPLILIAPGRFTFTRTGDISADLQVYFRVSGTASNGVDYQELPNQIVIPAGDRSAELNVLPRMDNIEEPQETVVVSLQHPPCAFLDVISPNCYVIGEPREAVVRINNHNPPNHPPVVRITEPVDGATYPHNADVRIRAATSDPDGYASRVEFYANGQKIGEDEIVFVRAPDPGTELEFEFVWLNAPSGNHTLTARTTDNGGMSAVSAPVEITVRNIPDGDQELHVVGLYSGLANGGSSRNHETGTASVRVDRPNKYVTLYLSAYEPVDWTISVSPGTIIERVYVSGYYRQTVSGLHGVPILNSSYEQGLAYHYTSHDINSSAYYYSVSFLHQLTGLQISSFHGFYTAPAEPILVSAVSDDPRLNNIFLVTPASDLPDLRFSLRFYSEGRIVTRNYTLSRPPVDGGLLIPGMLIVPDDSGTYYIGQRSHEVYRINRSTGHEEEMSFGPEIPELSWPRGVAHDPARNRVLLASLGGEGYLYGYSDNNWSVVSSMNNNDVDAIVVHSNRLYAVTTAFGDSSAPRLQQFSFNGMPVGEPIQLPHQQFQYANHTYQSELVSAGKYIVFLSEASSQHWEQDRAESRIYLIDPETREVWLTYRRVGRPAVATPVVRLYSPHHGETYRNGAPVKFEASATDADGVITRVEFYVDSLKVGNGTLNASGNFELTWTATPGRHVVWATAWDSAGNGESTDQVTISVSGTVPDPTIDDLCPCENPWVSRLDYLRCVINKSWELFRDGHITELERIEIIDAAAHASCGEAPAPRLLIQPQTAAEIQANGLCLVVSGADMENIVIESSTNLVDWSEVEASRATASAISVNCDNLNADLTRFYRIRPASLAAQ